MIAPIENKDTKKSFLMSIDLQNADAELWDVQGVEQATLRRQQKRRILVGFTYVLIGNLQSSS